MKGSQIIGLGVVVQGVLLAPIGGTAGGPGQKHAVTVVIEEPGGPKQGEIHLEVKAPSSTHRLSVYQGDSVEWTFDNRTSHKLELGIGHFRAHKNYEARDEPREIPVEAATGTKLSVPVAPNSKEVLKGRVRKTGLGNLTFKYDIIDFGHLLVLLDPEIEVYK